MSASLCRSRETQQADREERDRGGIVSNRMAWAGEVLIRRMADGDADACGRFYDRYAPLAYPLILRIVGDADVAADVLGDVFWEAWEAAGAYDDRLSPDAWIISRARARATRHVGERPPIEPAAALERLADLARQAPAVAPPPAVRTDLMRRVAALASPRSVWRRRRGLRWVVGSAAAVVGVAAFVAGLVASRYEARIGGMARETSRVRADLRREETTLRDRVAVAQGVVDVLLDPAARIVMLRGAGLAPAAVGRVIVNEAGGGYLFVANVPPAPSGQAYVLWAVVDGQSRPAGTFRPDSSGRATLAIAPMGAGGRPFTVTIEPEGSAAGPTGPVVLASPG